ncbi:hypothetical protein SASPL_125382 [Salvia splendens]|uniref:Nucleolar complex protein 2 n=1 Tax=Salvia splendens TaxID=180675 RepID=A0A8X8ZP48_SALSN|nr:hypothetical protein SASPL_125382 [Salvia splendens]
MGKLGKKARKFAKKHLQSVLKQRRKTKALFKRKAPKLNSCAFIHVQFLYTAENGLNDSEEETVDEYAGTFNGRNSEPESTVITSLDAAFTENETDEIALASDSDGYLSEDPSCPYSVESETEKTLEDTIVTVYSAQNSKIQSDLSALKKKLDRLRKKDPGFNNFLESFKSSAETIQNEDSGMVKVFNTARLIYGNVKKPSIMPDSITDSEILTFAMMRIRASLIFFVAFPSLVQRLLKATVHLWATSGRVLSSASFLVIRDVAAMFGSDHFDTCLAKTSISFLSRSRVTEITDIEHMQFLRDCIVELCCLDVQKSSVKAVASLSHCANIFSLALQTKKKEAVRKICSWEYVNCVDMWVRFISANIRDFDLQSLFFMTVKLINGVAHMFPGPRYLPLRLKSIEWLNCLSSSGGTFIPVASLVLDILEYKVVGEGRKAQIAIDTATVLKLPKHYLKSKSFQDECFQSAVKQLALHFSQWSYHISFPDLATIPLIRLRRILDITTLESLRRIVKRMIDQVEQNVDLVQKKREDAPFSPLDHQSADSFLQLEKSSLNSPFTQYYRSVLDKACERKLHKFDKKRYSYSHSSCPYGLTIVNDIKSNLDAILDESSCVCLPELKTSKKNAAKPKRKPVAAEDHPAENGTVSSK